MNTLLINDSRLVNATETISSIPHCIRELIENSIDAQSTIISVRLTGGGLESIVIVDNGCGISREGLELICTEGATSKILGSNTSGGRGKALNAISALSNLIVESSTSDNGTGYRLSFQDGERIIEPCARSRGTCITIQSIFHTYPVRRRYSIEHKSRIVSQIQDVCGFFAIATKISITLLVDNKNVIQVSNLNQSQRIKSILGINISKGLLTGSTCLDQWAPDSTLEYFTSSPTTQSNGKIFIVVNERPVYNNTLVHALKQEFHLCAGPKDPTIILYLTTPRRNYDFTPRDPIIEVWFKNESFLQQILRETFGSAWKKTSETLTFKDVSNPTQSPFSSPVIELKPSEQSAVRIKPHLTAQVYSSKSVSKITTQDIINRIEKSKQYTSNFGPSHNTIVTESFDNMEIIGQWNKSFLVTRLGSDIYAIDQHAACEAQNFEKLRKLTTKKKQVLIQPMIIKVSPEDLENAVIHKEQCSKFGFDYDVIDDAIHVFTVPSDKNVVNDATDLQELLGLIHDVPDSTPMTHNARIQLAYHACHSSVRVGDVMNTRQIKQLLQRMAHSDYPWNCPHGRPTWCCIKILDNEADSQSLEDESRPPSHFSRFEEPLEEISVT